MPTAPSTATVHFGADMTRYRIASNSIACALLIAAGGIGGCSGHGKYTTEGLVRAQTRMNQIKSATEWDMARQSFLAGNLDKALTKVDTSISLNDAVPKSHVLRGRILMEQGQIEEALLALQRAEVLDPEHVDAQYYMGIAFERLSKKEKALERYMAAAELDPAEAQYAVAASEMMTDLGRAEEAEAYLVEAAQRFEHSAGVQQSLGHLAMMRGDSETALERFTQARVLAPEDAVLLEDVAHAQIEEQRFAEAEYTLARLLKLESHTGRRDLMHLHARCLAVVDRPVDARDVLLELTKGAEGTADVQAWSSLGAVAHTLGDIRNLRIAATRVKAIDPNNATGFLLEAMWRRERGEPELALQSLSEALAREPHHLASLMLKGMVLSDMGRQGDAARTFAAAAHAYPDRADLAAMANAGNAAEFAAVETPE